MLSTVDQGTEKLIEQYPDETALVKCQLVELQSNIGSSIESRFPPTPETTPLRIQAAEPNETSADNRPGDFLKNVRRRDMCHDCRNEDYNHDELANGSPFGTEGSPRYCTHGEVQHTQTNATANQPDLRQIVYPQQSPTHAQCTTLTDWSPNTEIGSGDRNGEMAPPEHDLELQMDPHSPNGSRKRTGNEIVDSSSNLCGRNKQSRSGRAKAISNSSRELSVLSDNITRELHLLLDRHNVDKEASRKTMRNCVSWFMNSSHVHHLIETLRNTRDEASWRLTPTSTDIVATIQKLDQLDRNMSTCSVQRRVYLVRLLEHKDKLEDQVKDEGPGPSLPGSRGSNKRATRVLDKMLEILHPTENIRNLKGCDDRKYKRFKRSLENHLTPARKWSFIHKSFGLGMLFLIPAGPICEINNQEYVFQPSEKKATDEHSIERLSKNELQLLFEFISTHCGDTLQHFAEKITPHLTDVFDGKIAQQKFKFELLGEDDLLHASRDPAKLLESCVPVDESSSS